MDVFGRLNTKSKFGEKALKAPLQVREWISFLMHTPRYCRTNQRSTLENVSFVSSAISELLAKHCIKEVDNKPHICSPLSVVACSMGKRFKVAVPWPVSPEGQEDLSVDMQIFKPDDYLCTLYLKAGYHHVDINKIIWGSLGWWLHTAVLCFCVLPSSLPTACFVFTKLLHTLVSIGEVKVLLGWWHLWNPRKRKCSCVRQVLLPIWQSVSEFLFSSVPGWALTLIYI